MKGSNEQLARAFGLHSDADLERFVARLERGTCDPEQLRQGCLALFADRTEKAADARAQAALAASNLGFWEWDVAAGQVFCDRTFCRLLGLPEQDRTWLNAELAAAMHPDDLPVFTAAARESARGGTRRFEVCHRMKHADGRWVWIESVGDVTERDADGRAQRLTGTHADVTERKQLERALSSALRVMHDLLERLPLPITIRDSERRVTLANATWLNMYGLEREDVLGKRLDQLLSHARTTIHVQTDESLFANKTPLRYEATVTSVAGAVYNVLIAKTPLLSDDGSVTGIASVLTDISEQKRTAEALERARETAEAAMHAKSRFLANMSHELRTPLNGVVGMASLLENTALDAKQRRFVRTLKSSAEALITLINDVLDLSKAEAGKLELQRAPFDLRREFEQVVGLFSGRAHDRGIEIAAHIARDVPATIEGDSIRLRQVLGNLLNNAVKFTETGAVLLAVKTVVDARAECVLEFSVTDTGVGIPAREQQRIFEAFEQADGSVTRKFGGTGLGLAISRQLVELMQGTMHLESEADRGSRFSFRIPVGVPPAELPPVVPLAELGTLVIGMHPIVRSAVCDVLSAESMHVICVDSPIAAIEALADFGTRVSRIRVVIDSNAAARMESTVSGLRAAAAPRTLEVIALMPSDADAAPMAGVTRTLVKPLCTADLLPVAGQADSAPSVRVRALPVSGSRGRALVVEDNAVNQEMTRAMLDMLGFTVLTASNGLEGVKVATAASDLDLILMDCQMPVMDGLAAARAIRAQEPKGTRVPIVALTGNAMAGDREACIAAGMDDYLAKPFSLAALKALIDRWASAATQTARTKAR